MAKSTSWSGRHSRKDSLRQTIWTRLHTQGIALDHPWGRIPNFIGAEQAAFALAQLPQWQQAQVVKCNPDAPQTPVRRQALQDGKCLYMAVPKLTAAHCFVALTGEILAQKGISLDQGATKEHVLAYGTPVRFTDMDPIDLAVVGCVAVTPNGGRTGKGAGFADLEFALLQEHGLLSVKTVIATTVHDLQIVAADHLPMQTHDWPLDWVVTPSQVIPTHTPYPRPQGLDWQRLQPEQRQQIPALKSSQTKPFIANDPADILRASQDKGRMKAD
ncbi:MAG: 5-formyltetrahydrofolate cyclo-ligase [Cyanobacteria bacterium]|nr:5-formyltetrahydrofolate cyclo-ligase [Cyanobacteriota bacterium]